MTKNQSSWIWFLMAVLPIVLIIINQITMETGNLEITSLLNTMGFNTDYNEYNIAETTANDSVYKYTIYFNQPKGTSLEGIIGNMMNKLLENNNNIFVPQYVAYLIRLYIIKIAFDVFLLLPKICNRLINKAIGSGEVE